MDKIREISSDSKFWYLDLVLLLVYGAGLGYEAQRLADSGQIYTEKLVRTATAGFSSFLIAFVIAMLLKRWRSNHIYWLSASIIGSVVFAFLFGIVFFIVNSLGHWSFSELLRDNFAFFAGRIVFQSVFFAIPILSLLSLPRIFVYFFRISRVP